MCIPATGKPEWKEGAGKSIPRIITQTWIRQLRVSLKVSLRKALSTSLNIKKALSQLLGCFK